MSSEDWIEIGRIGKPHALAGAFFVVGREVNQELDRKIREFKVETLDQNHFIYKKSGERSVSGRLVLMLESVDTREKAEEIQGARLFVRRSDLKLRSGEFLWSDLVGRRIADCNGLDAGIVKTIDNFGAGEVLALQGDWGKAVLPLLDHLFDLSTLIDGDSLVLKMTLAELKEDWSA